jgi:alpha-methylacyl-CoA racemase
MALSHLKVLDLSRILPGPWAAQFLADHGADVIKVEAPADVSRTFNVMAREGGPDPMREAVDRNKRSIRIDLKSAKGRDLLRRLAATADVLIEGFRPGVVERLGIDYESLREVNSRLVYCSLTGYGQTGPFRERAGHDLNYLGLAGVADLTGRPGEAPAIPGVQIADLAGGSLLAVAGILVALAGRDHGGGQGQHVDISMYDGTLSLLTFQAMEHLLRGSTPTRGSEVTSGRYPCYGVYRTADDRWMTVGAQEPWFWSALCTALGRPDLEPDQYADGERGTEVRGELESLFARRTLAEWQDIFADVDACVEPVLTVDEALRHPQAIARQLVVTAPDGSKHLAPPIKLSGTPGNVRTPAPAPGAHTDEILGAVLGLDMGEISRLRGSGAVS